MSTKRITRHDENAHHIYGYVIVDRFPSSELVVQSLKVSKWEYCTGANVKTLCQFSGPHFDSGSPWNSHLYI